MAWSVELTQAAKRHLRKLDRQTQSRILDYLEDEIVVLEDPRSRGKALVGNKQGLWRYRVGDYRIICSIEDHRLVIVVLELGHRKDIYR